MKESLNKKKIVEYLTYRNDKIEAVKNQNYEKAANSRDKEIESIFEIYEILYKKEHVYKSEMKSKIQDYILERYNVSPDTNDPDLIIKIDRMNKLNELKI